MRQPRRPVPWGRGLEEYRAMFSVEPGYLQARILDCGGGPSSFAAEVAEQGGRVVAVDPLYADPAQELRQRIDASFDQVVELARRNPTASCGATASGHQRRSRS